MLFDKTMDYPDINIEGNNPRRSKKNKKKKLLKEQLKYYKRQNKLLELKIQKLESEKQQAEEEQTGAKQNENSKTNQQHTNSAKEFFHKLGQAVMKALPIIITPVTTAVLNYFLKGNRKSKCASCA